MGNAAMAIVLPGVRLDNACGICGRAFARPHGLFVHKLYAHGGDDEEPACTT